MRTTSSVIPVIAIVALCTATPWAAADQQRERGNRGRDQAAAAKDTSRERSSDKQITRDPQANTSRSRPSEPVAARPRDNGPRGNARGANDNAGNAPGRAIRDNAPNRDSNANRGSNANRDAYTNRDAYANRGGNASRDSYGNRGSFGRENSFSRGWSNGYRDSYYYRGIFSHHAYYRPMPYYGYRWRPYLDLGFGVWVGYPLMFPAESYYYSRSLTFASYGGLSFEVAPGEAYVYVDGNYVGAARDFGPFTQPLTLPVGMHRIAIDAPGYRGLEFSVEVLPGQLIPYRGQLEYLGPR